MTNSTWTDALSRVTPLPGTQRVQPWVSLGSWDLVAVLEQLPHYVVPTLGRRAPPPGMDELAQMWADLLLDGAPSPASFRTGPRRKA